MVFCLPFEMLRNYIFQPVVDRTTTSYEGYKRLTTERVVSAREIVFKTAIVVLAAAVIIWLAIFMYIVFYYTYMPAIAHVRPVHMQFEWVFWENSVWLRWPRSSNLTTHFQNVIVKYFSKLFFQHLRQSKGALLFPQSSCTINQKATTIDGWPTVPHFSQHRYAGIGAKSWARNVYGVCWNAWSIDKAP